MTDASEIAANRRRARALPMFGDGEIPAERNRRVEDDTSGFAAVVKLLARSWPYIRPQIIGRWWSSLRGAEDAVADPTPGDGFSFAYAPFLVALVVIAGPLFGLVPASLAWPTHLLYVPAIAMIIASYFMAYATGRRQNLAILGALLAGIAVNLAATYVIAGFADGLYAAAVTLAGVIGWTVQYRRAGGRIEYRVRSRAHLLYVYVLVFMERMVELTVAVILADFLNQSLLQNEPIAPGLANLFGIPEWARGSVQELTQDQQHQLKWIYATVALAGYTLQKILQSLREYYGIWVLQMVNQDLRVALLERWHQLSLRYHSGHRSGDSVFRIYQDSAMITAVIAHLSGIAVALLGYVVSVALITLLSPPIGLLAVVLVLPAIVWSRWAMPRMRTRALVYRERTSDVTATIQETFSTLRLIKAFGTSAAAQRRLENDSIDAFNAGFQVRVLIALVTIVMFTMASTFMIGGEFVMAWWAHANDPTFATELIALIGVSFVVWNLASFSWARDQFRASSGSIRKTLNDWMMAQDMAMGLGRVFDILDIEPEVQDRADAVPLTAFAREIRYENVSFAYEPDRPVLAGVSFTAPAGSVTAIVGPTGSGKSTVASLLLRLFDPDAGSITIDGKDIREVTLESLRSNIAIALQENVLFAMSVGENIRYVAPQASDAEVREAARIAAMDDYLASLPQGLDTVLSDRGGKLSTGQRQRLSIARAMVRNTPILILDEPTAALDAATEHEVMTNLAAWVRGASNDPATQRIKRTVIVITHRISTIRRADNILYLDGGRIIERGDHDTLMRIEGGRYRAFVDAEFQLRNEKRPGGHG